MDRVTSKPPYQPLNDAPDGTAKDTKATGEKTDARSVPSKLKGAVQVPAKTLDEKSAPSSTPSKLLQAWAQEPTQKKLEKDMALAIRISRISGPFGAFVQAACPSLSKKDYAEAVDLIAQMAPVPEDATAAQVATHVNEFLPTHEVWSQDGRTPVQRAEHLMKVIRQCKAAYVSDAVYESVGVGHNPLPTTARALWSQVRD